MDLLIDQITQDMPGRREIQYVAEPKALTLIDKFNIYGQTDLPETIILIQMSWEKIVTDRAMMTKKLICKKRGIDSPV